MKKTSFLATTGILTAITFLLGLTPIGIIPIPPANITIMHIPVIIGTLALGLKVGMILGGVFGITSVIRAFMAPSALVLPLLGESAVYVILMSFGARLLVPVAVHFAAKGIGVLQKKMRPMQAALLASGLVAFLIGMMELGLAHMNFEKGTGTLLSVLLAVAGAIFIALLLAFAGRKKNQKNLPAIVGAAAGTMTNTICYLGLMLLFYTLCGLGSETVLATIAGAGALNGSLEAVAAMLVATPVVAALEKAKGKEKTA